MQYSLFYQAIHLTNYYSMITLPRCTIEYSLLAIKSVKVCAIQIFREEAFAQKIVFRSNTIVCSCITDEKDKRTVMKNKSDYTLCAN